MRHVACLIAGVAAMVLAASSAEATMRITSDPGGRLLDYAERFLRARESGEQVIIDGSCLSACTLAIGMVPREQVCATRKAVLGFHAAWRLTPEGGKAPSPAATKAMMDLYPQEVREWIARQGGLTRHMIYLRGRELAAMVPLCSEAVVARVDGREAPGRRIKPTARGPLVAHEPRQAARPPQ